MDDAKSGRARAILDGISLSHLITFIQRVRGLASRLPCCRFPPLEAIAFVTPDRNKS
jgi:hypothetical protein